MPNQIELFEIENPCIGVCESNKKGYCFGCLRHRTERQLWLLMSNEEKRDILRLISGRRQRLEHMRRHQHEQMSLSLDDHWEAGDLF